jgi:hypothetical protein
MANSPKKYHGLEYKLQKFPKTNTKIFIQYTTMNKKLYNEISEYSNDNT